jgi:hypothetical protein
VARENLIARTFVELAGTLAEGCDPLEFLRHLAKRCVEVLAMAEAGLALVDVRGQPQALATSSKRMYLTELFEVQHEDGPCLDYWRSGQAAAEDHLDGATGHWPYVASVALEAGFASVDAVALRLRDERLGALDLFANEAAVLADIDLVLAQTMADVATIDIPLERFIARREEVAAQLQVGFNTRVVLEQAKGVAAEAMRTDMDKAFALLHGYARHHNLLLSEVARQVIDRELAARSQRRTRGPAPKPSGPPPLNPRQAGRHYRPPEALDPTLRPPCGAPGMVVALHTAGAVGPIGP